MTKQEIFEEIEILIEELHKTEMKATDLKFKIMQLETKAHYADDEEYPWSVTLKHNRRS